MCRDITVKNSWPLRGCRRKDALEMTPCNLHPDSLFYLVLLASPGVKEGVLIEQDGASSIVCHVEAIRQELMLEVHNTFLWCDDVPFFRNMLVDGSFFSTSRFRVPIVFAEPSLFCQWVGHLVVKSIFLRRRIMSSGWCLAENGIETSRIDNVTPENGLRVRLHPDRKTIPYGQDIFFIAR